MADLLITSEVIRHIQSLSDAVKELQTVSEVVETIPRMEESLFHAMAQATTR